MVVEESERSANDRLVVVARIPRNRETRRPIVFVARKALLDAHRVLRGENVSGGKRDARQRIVQRQRRDLFGDLVVVTHAVVERQVRTHLPRILHEEREWFVADAADRITKTLNVVCRETKTVLLHGSDVRRRREHRRRQGAKLGHERAGAESAEVEETGEVEFKDRLRNANERRIATELEVVIVRDEIHVVGELVKRFGAHYRREQFAAEERGAGNIERDCVTVL